MALVTSWHPMAPIAPTPGSGSEPVSSGSASLGHPSRNLLSRVVSKTERTGFAFQGPGALVSCHRAAIAGGTGPVSPVDTSEATSGQRNSGLPLADKDASWQYKISLGNIRGALIRQEDSIIFSLIERAQFLLNCPAYSTDPAQGGIEVPGFQGSLMEYVMTETEILHGKVLHPAAQGININAVIWEMYFQELLPAIAAPGDDYNYGSAVTCDVICLQALSSRIHYGVFVAESKFLEAPSLFEPLIKAQDSAGILQLLTKPDVEAAVLRRVEAKAAAFGQEISTPQTSAPQLEPTPGHTDIPIATGKTASITAHDGPQTMNQGFFEASGQEHSSPQERRFKVEPRVVAELYGRWIMPLTKQVQVDYLLRRLDPE